MDIRVKPEYNSEYTKPNMKTYYVYIMTNEPYGTLYIGVTSNLSKRIYEHKNGLIDGFTKKYELTKLVYIEETNQIYSAITREKALKRWNRDWKIDLINNYNPSWRDLSEEFL
jgi:putative endonuclease